MFPVDSMSLESILNLAHILYLLIELFNPFIFNVIKFIYICHFAFCFLCLIFSVSSPLLFLYIKWIFSNVALLLIYWFPSLYIFRFLVVALRFIICILSELASGSYWTNFIDIQKHYSYVIIFPFLPFCHVIFIHIRFINATNPTIHHYNWYL